MTPSHLILNECPRDAMQGLAHFVPTDTKIRYLNALLQVGFSTLDFGSFVSPKAIPQLRDTSEVLAHLDLSMSQTKLLAIVANQRGAEQAMEFGQIHYLGFPLSVSETFQQRNTNKSIREAFEEVSKMQNLCLIHGKTLVVYLSMAFGNPYGDFYSPDVVLQAGEKLLELGITHISLADTVGLAGPSEVQTLFSTVNKFWKEVQITAHLHAAPEMARPKIQAAWDAGCRRFDVALGGYGGCPMAEDELVGNLSTERMVDWARENHLPLSLNFNALEKAQAMMAEVFH